MNYLNLEQRIALCRENECPSCKAGVGQPCVFTQPVMSKLPGMVMQVHHDKRWQRASGWPYGPLVPEDMPLDTRGKINANDSVGGE